MSQQGMGMGQSGMGPVSKAWDSRAWARQACRDRLSVSKDSNLASKDNSTVNRQVSLP